VHIERIRNFYSILPRIRPIKPPPKFKTGGTIFTLVSQFLFYNWAYNNMDLKEMRYVDKDWIHLAEDRTSGRVL
jgi:hypothetical protein